MSLYELRDYARKRAEAKGHTIKRWNGRPFRYTAVCAKRRGGIAVYSQLNDSGVLPDFSDSGGGLIVARDDKNYSTGRDFNWAGGIILLESCRGY